MKRYDPQHICDNLRAEVAAESATGPAAAPRPLVTPEPAPEAAAVAGDISLPQPPSRLLYPDVIGKMEGSVWIGEVPAGTSMRFVKRVVLRFLRLITARQMDFNFSVSTAIHALTEHGDKVSESLQALSAALEQERQEQQALMVALNEERQALNEERQLVNAQKAELDAVRAEVERRRGWWEGERALDAKVEAWLKTLDGQVEGLRSSQRQMLGAIQDEMRQMSTSPAPASSGAGAPPPVESAAPALQGLDDVAYRLYEDQWRGSAEAIRAAQEEYVTLLMPHLEKLGADLRTVLDIGFGRGEFMKTLQDRGLRPVGVDINRSSVIEAREAGFDVYEADAAAYLRTQPDNRFGAMTAFQVVEHMTVAEVRELAQLVWAKLAPGGVALFETINPGTFAAFRWFYLDLTHTRLMPPESLRFVCECAGMEHVETRLIHPVADYERLAETGDDTERENIRRLNTVLFGPQDYYLLVRKPAGGATA